MQQFRVLAIAVVVVASSVVSQWQTKASCTFKLFQVPSGQSNGVTGRGTQLRNLRLNLRVSQYPDHYPLPMHHPLPN
jgi:hypothetical protein